jgi:antirestriction protein
MRVYVGTYGKYASGSIAGAWLDLDDYSDISEFYEACRELHKDEADPEYMFQDWVSIPEGMIGESYIEEEVFELAQLSDDDLKLMQVYRSHVNQDGTLEEAREEFRGTYSSPADYAEEYWYEMHNMDKIPSELRCAIDWEVVARDMDFGGYTFVRHDGETWVFVS